MKPLFEDRFRFVKKEDSELTEEQLSIKRQYEKYYPKPSKEIAIFTKKEKVD